MDVNAVNLQYTFSEYCESPLSKDDVLHLRRSINLRRTSKHYRLAIGCILCALAMLISLLVGFSSAQGPFTVQVSMVAALAVLGAILVSSWSTDNKPFVHIVIGDVTLGLLYKDLEPAPSPDKAGDSDQALQLCIAIQGAGRGILRFEQRLIDQLQKA